MYRVTVRGHLSERFASAFNGMTREVGVGETHLLGHLDQARLEGVLDRVRNFGLELVSVQEVPDDTW